MVKSVFKRRSIFFIWFLSYIAILLIPALINISVYFKTENIIENEVNEAYSVLLNQLQGVMDQHINNIKKMVVDISVNSNVNSFMYAKKPLYKHNYYSKFHTMTQMPKDMVIYKNANDIIDDFYIYFMYSDIIISPSAVNSPLTMYNYVYKFKGMTFEQWDQVFLQKRYDNSYSLAEVEDTRGNTKNVIVFAHSLPLGYTTNKIANIFIMIDEDKLLQILVNTKLKEAGSAFIIDKDNTVLLSTKPYGDNPVCYEELRSGEGLIYKEIEGQKVVISHISSSVNDWEYVSVVPTAVFREKIVYIKKITYFSMLVYLFIGLVISYLFTRKNYKPLGDLVYTIADTGLNPIKKSNEIQYIKDAVHKTIIMQGEIDKQKNTLRNNFIRSLVLGKFDNQVHIDELLNFYSIDFDLSKPYTISLFYMYEFNKLSGITNNNNELGIYHSLVIDAISKTMEGNYKIYLFEVDDMLGCITSSVEDHHQDDIEKLTALCSAILDFLESNFNLYITVSLSRWHGGYRDLKSAYQEAEIAMEFRRVKKTKDILFYGSVSGNHNDIYYPINVERQLINNTKAGNLGGVLNIIGEIFDKNNCTGNITIKTMRFLISEMTGTVIKVLIEMGYTNSFDRDHNNQSELVKNLNMCDGVTDVKDQIIAIFKELCNYVEKDKQSHNVELKTELLRYIEENYDNTQLSISLMAAEFALNPDYLSRFFKEQVGEGLLSYIHKTRLNHAKERLINSDSSILDIAKDVGYYNSSSFIRKFKEIEGITPGEYKKLLNN